MFPQTLKTLKNDWHVPKNADINNEHSSHIETVVLLSRKALKQGLCRDLNKIDRFIL